MKKTIFAIIMAAIVGLFAVSCSKSQMNSSKLIGTWKITSVVEASASGTYSPNLDNETYTIQFAKDGTFVFSGASSKGSGSAKGTWTVVEDTIAIVVDNGYFDIVSGTWTITTLNAKSLVITQVDDGESITISMSKL